jgi:hypothetical protein
MARPRVRKNSDAARRRGVAADARRGRARSARHTSLKQLEKGSPLDVCLGLGDDPTILTQVFNLEDSFSVLAKHTNNGIFRNNFPFQKQKTLRI